MADPTPAENARFTDVGGGTISEMMADQVQFFYNPTTGDARSIFNGLPFLNINNKYLSLNSNYDILQVSFNDKMLTCYAAGLASPALDPVTGVDLAGVSVAGVMTLIKLVYDAEFNDRAKGGNPVAGFSVSAGNGLTVTFTDTTVPSFLGTITGWVWDFGDAIPATGTDPAVPSGKSTEQNPVYTFAAAGTYTVELDVTASNETTATIRLNVTVTAAAPTPAP